jgi:cyclopropane-fatty-acyl-phospholipid synthase
VRLSKLVGILILVVILRIAFATYKGSLTSYSFSPFSKSSSKQLVQDLFAQADIQFNGQRPWDIQVHDDAFYARLFRDGSLGFGESYTEGMWDCDELDECIARVLKGNLYEKVSNSWPILWMAIKAKLYNLQDKLGSMAVIDQHYQIGNEFYQAMLDSTLAYSCGYWKDASDLDKAQEAKYDLICKKLYFKPGMRVLDIGCGWGGFAKYAADNYRVHVVGITLSNNQAEYARLISQGLSVEIHVADYRDMNEPFDRILEIGMFEHVGVKNYREFMEVVHRCLKEDGLFLLHTIGSNATSITTDPWIDKYIFPNGHIPSIAQIGECAEGLFIMEDWHNFGSDYDKTLLAWYGNFNKNWNKLSDNPGNSFYRMWRYYLLSCAGCFRARDIQLWQIVFSKNGVPNGYTSIR